MEEIFKNAEKELGRPLTEEEKDNLRAIYGGDC